MSLPTKWEAPRNAMAHPQLSVAVSICPRVPDSNSQRAQGGKKQRAKKLNEKREKAMCTKGKRNNDGQGGKAIPQLPPDRSRSSGPIDMSEAQDFAILRIFMLQCLLSIPCRGTRSPFAVPSANPFKPSSAPPLRLNLEEKAMNLDRDPPGVLG
jgi:hypothetical protein